MLLDVRGCLLALSDSVTQMYIMLMDGRDMQDADIALDVGGRSRCVCNFI